MSTQSSLPSFGKVAGFLFTRQNPSNHAATHSGFISRFNNWRERRAAASELSRLSDRELADIGLTRQQIPEVVHGARQA